MDAIDIGRVRLPPAPPPGAVRSLRLVDGFHSLSGARISGLVDAIGISCAAAKCSPSFVAYPLQRAAGRWRTTKN
jgi:hypothetical protein